MERAFVDTSAWLALVDRDEPRRRAVRRALDRFAGRLVTSNFVFDETVTRCVYGQDHALAVRVGTQLLDARVTDLARVTLEDERAAWSLFLSRRDQSYSFTDCTSFVLMRRLALGKAIALDEDFAREGFELLPG